MQPDPEKASCDESAEKEILESQSKYARRRFSSVSTCHAGATFGAGSPDPPEALRTIPSLSLHDIPKMPIRVPTEVGDINGVKVLQHDLFANDVLSTESAVAGDGDKGLDFCVI